MSRRIICDKCGAEGTTQPGTSKYGSPKEWTSVTMTFNSTMRAAQQKITDLCTKCSIELGWDPAAPYVSEMPDGFIEWITEQVSDNLQP